MRSIRITKLEKSNLTILSKIKRETIEVNYDKSMKIMCEACNIPLWDEKEYRFIPNKAWIFDYAWTSLKLAVDIDETNCHVLKRFEADREKSNLATIEGWKVIHISTKELKYPDAVPIKKNKKGKFIIPKTVRYCPIQLIKMLFATIV
jgi:hypothetical protein